MTIHRRAATLVVAALAFVVAGCGAPAEPERAETTPSPPPSATAATPTPSSNSSIPTRAADLPTAEAPLPSPSRLIVEAAALDIPVRPVGVAEDGQMELPANPALIGWYRFGPGPADDQGTVVLGGHLDSKEYGVGPLVRLRRVEAGDLITVRSTDGSTSRYRVRRVEDIAKRKLPVDQLFAREGPRVLKVVTCGGPYNEATGGYRDNLVVTAVPA
ncbi:sortase domain-containing protein [Kribbella sp. CA-247076]|uniref:class F sortase n=1 Tax=Kribbella sp. CA-247076 TaxID=3239941 RepID=UPI003D925429